MESCIEKLLIEAENSIWVMQNNFSDKEMVEKFALKLCNIAKKILKETETNDSRDFEG